MAAASRGNPYSMTCDVAPSMHVCPDGQAGSLIGPVALATIQPVHPIWATRMKTTIELPDDLLERSKALARRENSTLKALIEEGLHLALRARTRKRAAAPFAVQPFRGDGLSPEFADAGWEKLRDEIDRDRG
jgi:hypothetical protein